MLWHPKEWLFEFNLLQVTNATLVLEILLIIVLECFCDILRLET